MDTSESGSITSGSAIEQFVLLANGTKGMATVNLIKQVLEASNVFVFGELLDHPNIQALKNEESSSDSLKYFNLLNLFAYETYTEYLSNQENLPEINDLMRKKLKLLTLVSLATKSRLLKYDELQSKLEIDNVRELEDLIIEGGSYNVIQGKLDQKQLQYEVDFAMARDIRKNEVDGIVESLEEWCNQCDVMLNYLDKESKRANENKRLNIEHEKLIKSKIEQIRASMSQSGSSKESEMDYDRPEGRDRKFLKSKVKSSMWKS